MSYELSKIKNCTYFRGHFKVLCTKNKNHNNNSAQISAVFQEHILSLYGFPEAISLLKFAKVALNVLNTY